MKQYSLAQKESAIKRINERFAELKRSVNKGDLPQSIVDRYADAMRAAAGENLLKSGNISHGKKAALAISDDDITNLLSRETAGEARKKIKQQVAREYGSDYTRADMEQYFSDMDFVNSELSEKPTETYDAFDKAFRGVSGVKTYAQLANAIRAFDNNSVESNPFDAQAYYFN